MKITKTGKTATPRIITLEDKTKITLIRQSKLDSEWMRKHSCSLIAESYALQWLGVKGYDLNLLLKWHKKNTPNKIPSKVAISAVASCVNTLAKGKGTAKYYKTPTADRIKKALKEGRMVLFERGKPNSEIHTVTFLRDDGTNYLLNIANATSLNISSEMNKRSQKSSTHCGMIVVSRVSSGMYADSSSDEDVDTELIKKEPLTFEKRKNPNGWDLYKNNEYYKPPKNNQEFNTKTGGNCVWYAYGRFLEVWSKAPASERKAHPWPGFFSQNGYKMVAAARDKGFATGLTPRPGAIISWGYYGSADGSPGHVAFVEDVKYDKNGNVTSIEISQSGWSVGDMKNQTLTPGDGKKGTNAYKLGFNASYFLGFAYNPIEFGKSSVYAGNEYLDDEEIAETTLDMQTRSSRLVSSDNYSFITAQKEEAETATSTSMSQSFVNSFKNTVNTINAIKEQALSSADTLQSRSLAESLNTIISDAFAYAYNSVTRQILVNSRKTNSTLAIADSVVEAPFIELEIGGYKIGSYRGSIDEYPNYINSLTVSKQNGVINQYQIQLIHQIRAGDDPNLLDELFSTVTYDQITIRYGDCSTDTYFRDDRAIITNINMNRNYSSMVISYVLEATSEGELVKTYTTNFPAITDKPSNVIRKILYDSGEVSKILLDAFPGMRNRTLVESAGLIPTNDRVVQLDAQTNANPIDYLTYLVGNMSDVFGKIYDKFTDIWGRIREKEKDIYEEVTDIGKNQWSGNTPVVNTADTASGTIKSSIDSAGSIIRDSTYYITFNDADTVIPDGSYISVTEVSADVDPFKVSTRVYEITIGYPDDIVFDFTVESTNSWELLYENKQKATEYYYTITNDGDVTKMYSPSISSSVHEMSELNKNWWTQMVRFPISASLTIKGLLKPVMLMEYIKINVMFYGQKHITSGIYAITGQTDTLSGAGYRTTLSLTRVGSD